MTVLAAGRVVTAAEVFAPGWVQYDAGRIVAVGAGRPVHIDRDLPDAVVVPGFVDMHVHGGGGGSFTDPGTDSSLLAVRTHRQHGTTTTMASLVTASPATLLASVAMLAELHEAGDIAGVHLEGPWISPDRCGAHDRAQLRHPDRAELGRLLVAGRGAIRMVTLAPELPGALDAVRQVVDGGAIAALGHTDASYAQTVAALDAGATVGTHLFNAMRAIHHRRPGPIPALLEDTRVTVEVVADGTHVHPALYGLITGMAGSDRVALVTDAMAAATLGDGSYRLGSLNVAVQGGVARISGTDTIAGSTATMAQLFRTAAGHRFDVVSPASALRRAVRQTSTNPAMALGRVDVGDIRPGMRADLVVLDSELGVVEVLRGGV